MEFKLSKPILAGLAGLSLVFVSACAPADEPAPDRRQQRRRNCGN